MNTPCSQPFLVAGLCEELCKFLLLRLGSWKNRNFDYRFDGIVYGVAVAVGFALLENVMYVAQGGLETALMRGVWQFLSTHSAECLWEYSTVPPRRTA